MSSERASPITEHTEGEAGWILVSAWDCQTGMECGKILGVGYQVGIGNFMRLILIKVFSFIALLGLIASFIIHIASFFCISTSSEAILILTVGIFVVIMPGKWLASGKRKGWKEKLDMLPDWLVAMCGFIAIYSFFNFFIMLGLMEGGYGELRDGHYYLMNHNKIIKEITEQKFHWSNAYQTRLFSGHWMIFYILAFASLWLARNTAQASTADVTEDENAR